MHSIKCTWYKYRQINTKHQNIYNRLSVLFPLFCIIIRPTLFSWKQEEGWVVAAELFWHHQQHLQRSNQHISPGKWEWMSDSFIHGCSFKVEITQGKKKQWFKKKKKNYKWLLLQKYLWKKTYSNSIDFLNANIITVAIH